MKLAVLTSWTVLCLIPSFAWSADSERVSVFSDGTQGADHSALGGVDISANGRFVAFDCAGSLETGRAAGVYLHDRVTGETRLVSLSSGGVALEGQYPSVSDDGLFIAFEAFDEESSHTQVLVRNLATGTTAIASTGPNGAGTGNSHRPSLSATGRYTAFSSDAGDLIAGDTNGAADIFVFDWDTGTLVRASVSTGGAQSNNISENAALSGGGKLVAFMSRADNLVANDTNHTPDIFMRDLVNQVTFRLSTGSDGSQANDESTFPSVAGDGSKVAFQSKASNLVSGDGGLWDVFVKDVVTGAIEIASVNSSGAHGDGNSCLPMLSRDAARVAFASFSSNLAADDTNGVADVFVHDFVQGITFRVSTATDGTQGDVDSGILGLSLSTDGCMVAYQSEATTLIANDTNGKSDAFVTDACSGGSTNYGAGWSGTTGIPSLLCTNTPKLCTPLTLAVGNSLGADTLATLFIGLRDVAIPTPWDGTLLLLPICSFTLAVPAGGAALPASIPCDSLLRGARGFLQATEIDPGASHGIAFSRGLAIVIGS